MIKEKEEEFKENAAAYAAAWDGKVVDDAT